MKLAHKFVKNVSEELEDGVLYISVEYASAIHKCCCGCGSEVVTPFSPTDWKLIFEGKTVSLYPSIGNWSLKCRSHYWITNSEVRWARKWTRHEIEYGRKQDEADKMAYYQGKQPSKGRSPRGKRKK